MFYSYYTQKKKSYVNKLQCKHLGHLGIASPYDWLDFTWLNILHSLKPTSVALDWIDKSWISFAIRRTRSWTYKSRKVTRLAEPIGHSIIQLANNTAVPHQKNATGLEMATDWIVPEYCLTWTRPKQVEFDLNLTWPDGLGGSGRVRVFYLTII